MASVRFKPMIFCSLSNELVQNEASRMQLFFFYSYKAVQFCLFKQTPFQRVQALIKITLNKIDNSESFVDTENGISMFLNKKNVMFF